MRLLLLIILLTCKAAFASDAVTAITQEDTSAAANDAMSDDDTGWVEEQISPTTKAVEDWYSPFARWMEGKIQGPHDEAFTPQLENQQLDKSSELTDVQPEPLISPEQASQYALKMHKGNVLKIRFIQQPAPHYSVRLLTRQGQITTLNIDAHTGQALATNDGMDSNTEGEQ